MRVSRARHVSISAALCLALVAAVTPAAAAGPSLRPPGSMAAVGDSITQAASTGGSLGADYPANSWSTGTNTTVNSHLLRLSALNPSITATNASVSGAKVADLDAQMRSLAGAQPDYLTVLIGGNDLCTDTVGEMTATATFEAQFRTAMTTLLGTAGGSAGVSPETRVYVVSIPNVYQLWELFRGNWWARTVWSAGDICQSLLANPTSTQQADVQRRAAVRQRNAEYNQALADVCAEFAARCHWDGLAVFNTVLQRSDVSGDYFHPSTSGQARLAAVSWGAGYAWQTVNQGPIASFTYACSGLSCTFDDTSTDADGSIASRSWSFGGSGDPQSHTFAAEGTHSVTLTVIDNGGASSSVTQQVTVSAPTAAERVHVGALDATSAVVDKRAWRATVTITVVDTSGDPVANATVSGGWSVGASDTCLTGSAGTCQVMSDNLARRSVGSVTFTVSGVSLATLGYDASANVESSITVQRP